MNALAEERVCCFVRENMEGVRREAEEMEERGGEAR